MLRNTKNGNESCLRMNSICAPQTPLLYDFGNPQKFFCVCPFLTYEDCLWSCKLIYQTAVILQWDLSNSDTLRTISGVHFMEMS